MSQTGGVRGGQRLGPGERIRSKVDFASIYRSGRRGGDDVLRVLVGPNGLSNSRIGCAVPRRYGNAVARNKLRRLYKEAFRLEKGALPAGYDVVCSPPRGKAVPALEDLRAALVRNVAKVVARLEKQQAKKASAAPAAAAGEVAAPAEAQRADAPAGGEASE